MRLAFALAAGLLLFAGLPSAPNVAADPVANLLPPTDFTGNYNATTRTVHLSWNPPSGNVSPDSYEVQRNGIVVAVVNSTGYSEVVPSVQGVTAAAYSVAARYGATTSSSSSAFVTTLILWCEIVSFGTYWEWPFIDFDVHEECAPPIGPIGGTPRLLPFNFHARAFQFG